MATGTQNTFIGQTAESGMTEVYSVAAKSYKDVAITYANTFTFNPLVILTMNSSLPGAGGSTSVAVCNETTSGCTIRIFNASTAARSIGVQWAAVTS